ncbi:MAG: hypothetical protein IJ231_10705 [Clostridia bacterium]|nr:hypothetical protein [Clostridia bacterium]
MKGLSGRRMRQISQTVLARLNEGLKGAPASYSEEEKKYYGDFEKEILADRAAGRIVNYDFPNDYDWDNEDDD